MKKLGGKKILVGALSAALAAGSAMTAFAAPGWNQNTTGWWWENADGSYVVNNWVQDAGKWYFMDGNGYMSCGWIWDNGNWYFADASGAMLTGWVRVDGAVYYLNPVSDGTQGAMATGVRTIDGVSYTFDASGACMNSGSYNRAEIPSYNGNGTVAAVPVEAHASRPSGGGSSSGGSSTTTTDAEDKIEEVADSINTVKEQIAADETSAIDGEKIALTTSGSKTTVVVPLKEDAVLTQTVDEVASEMVSMAEEVIEGAIKVVYTKSNGEKITAYADPADGTTDISIDTLKNNLSGLAGDRTLEELVGKTYSVDVTMADGSVATYTFTVTQ